MNEEPDAPVDPATFWEGRYAEQEKTWSGRVNAALEREAAGLAPGRALDLGCGEGGDALWLARAGWSVTAVDIAATALARGAAEAAREGLADRVRWVEADLATWPPDGPYDLVSACFLHSPVELPREQILRRVRSAVAPGGALLVVGHAEFPPWSHHHPEDGVPLPTAEEVLATLELPAAGWTVVTKAAVDRAVTGPDGAPATLVDAVLRLRRG